MTKTIYLDQMKWIDLARAETGHAEGAKYVPVLETFKRAADDGHARFVLSAAHYIETGKQGVRRRREELSSTMMRLAGMNRIAPPHVIVPLEIRKALIEVFELPVPLPQLQLFGSGGEHALALPSVRYRAPEVFDGIALPESARHALEE